jgi:hypothetical protein
LAETCKRGDGSGHDVDISIKTEERRTCAICIAMLSEENQHLLSLGPCCTTRGGSVKFTDLPGETAQTPFFCYMCLFGHFSKRAVA